MESRDLKQVEIVFHAALDLPEAKRKEYLQQACGGDESLLAEVTSLLTSFEKSNGFMDQPALGLAYNVLHNESEESLVGRSYGVYRIVSPLGKGGMGEVYLAEDTRLNRKVALKFLPAEFVADRWAKRQLVKEAQAAAMLDHPNICAVYGIEDVAEHTFIVMQFIQGETLADVIQKHQLTPEQMIPLARQIVSALAEAHAHGIIHRDIKPRNIMVTPSGQVKVLDFGLAKNVVAKSLESLDDTLSKLSEIGLVPGTIRYMSPEQLRNERLDYRSDIFSLGTVFYEMLSGNNPFERKTGPEVISAILSSTPRPLTENCTQLPDLAPLIERCLAKEKSERYQSAAELLLDLDKLEKGIPLLQERRYFPGLRAAGIMAFLLVLALTGVILYSLLTTKKHAVGIFNFTCEDIPADICPGPAIRQQLINHLSRRPDLRTHSFETAIPINAHALGRDNKVELILSGKIVSRGETLVLKTRLENVADGLKLAENEYPVPSQTMPFLEELSVRLAFNPDLPSTQDQQSLLASLAALQNRDPTAVELYYRGRHYWNKRDKKNVPMAIALFEQAIERDQTYAPAYAGLADCYVMMPSVAYGKMETKEAMDRASAAARKALELDPNLSEAHTSLGIVQLRYEWKWQAAEKSFKRAIALKPDSADAHYWYSSLLGTTGRLAESIAESERAKQLDPLFPLFVTNLGRAYYRARDFDKTIEYFKGVLAEKPDNQSAMYVIGLAYLQKNMYAEAIDILETLSKSNWQLSAAPLGYAYARVGRPDEAHRLLERMEEASKHEYLPAQERAIVYIGLGDHDSAFYWLEKSYDERFGSIIALTTDPIFDNLKSDPRFAVLARKVNLIP